MEDIDYLTLNKKEEAIILEALDDSRYSNISSIRKFMLSGDEDLIPYCENKIIEIEKLNQKDIFGSITEKEKKENLKQISIIAGGDKYSWFLSNYDNEEI